MTSKIFYDVLRTVWLRLRSFIELFIPRQRLDGWLARFNFFQWKDNLFVFQHRLPDGTTFLMHSDDQRIFSEIYEQGCYSRTRITDGDVVLDIGAHIGTFTVSAARQTPNGRVIAIEPAPPNRELLRRNIALNHLSNVTILDCALSDAAGEATLFFPGDHAMYSLHPSGTSPASYPVRLRTLEDVFQSEHIASCSVLKLDAEGSELAILRGGTRALTLTRQVIVEAEKNNDNHEKVLTLLHDAGFACEILQDTQGAILAYAQRVP